MPQPQPTPISPVASQALIISWTSPTPFPLCGFSTSYRANGNPSYLITNTSGNTSGGIVTIPSLAPACYEGFVESNCCGSSLSANSPFGVNAWQPIFAQIVNGSNSYTLNITSAFPNSYDVILSGNLLITNTSGTVANPFNLTYPAGTTIITSAHPKDTTITYFLEVDSVTPVFDNGGQLQQFDSVNTPRYFQFYSTSGCTSGSTSGCTAPIWNGSPLYLPSFILSAFNVTTIDVSGNPLTGNLIVTWIQDYVYNGGVGIYNQIIFSVYDPNTTLMEYSNNFYYKSFC